MRKRKTHSQKAIPDKIFIINPEEEIRGNKRFSMNNNPKNANMFKQVERSFL